MGNVCQDVALTFGQWCWHLSTAEYAFHRIPEPLRYLWLQERAAFRRYAHSMQHFIKSRAFEQVSFSTGSNSIENTFVGSVGGQNDYSRVGKLNPDTLKHAHAVKVGHLQVQQYDVG